MITSLIQVINPSFLNATSLWIQDKFFDELNSNIYQARRASIFGYVNQNELGLSFIPLISILLGVLLKKGYRYTYFFLISGGIIALMSNTRYVIIGFFIITIQIIISQKSKIGGSIKYLFIVGIGTIFLYQILSWLGYDILDWIDNRLLSEGSFEETTRYKAIANFLIFFPQAPFLGTGGMTREIYDASQSVGSSQIHVGYLAHLVYFGVIGSILLFGFWAILLRKLYRTAKLSNYWGSFFGFLVFLWANATLVCFNMFFYGIIFLLVLDKYYSDEFDKNKRMKAN